MNRLVILLVIVVAVTVAHGQLPPGGDVASSPSAALGLTLYDQDMQLIRLLMKLRGLAPRDSVWIRQLKPESPAAAAGIRESDILLAVGGKNVTSVAEVEAALTGATGPVPFLVCHDDTTTGATTTCTVTLPGGAPAQPAQTPAVEDTHARVTELIRQLETGQITNDDYNRRIAELFGGGQAQHHSQTPDPGLQQKLKALDDALAAGVISQAEYDQKRSALLPQQAAPQPGAVQPAAPQPQSTQLHQLVSGFSFRTPAAWTITENGPTVVLAPAAPQPGTPEAYVLLGANVAQDGVTHVNDPRLLQFLHGEVQAILAGAQITAGPTPLNIPAGQGAVLEWTAQTPKLGEMRAKAFYVILSGWGVSMLAIGPPGQLNARDAELRNIFKSFRFAHGPTGSVFASTPAPTPGTGQIDQRLVGNWMSEKTFSMSGGGHTTVDCLSLLSNGTFTFGSQFAVSTDAGGWTSDQSDSSGQWSTANSILTLTYRDGSSDRGQYYVEDPNRPGTTASTMGKWLLLVTLEDGTRFMFSKVD